MTDWTAALHPTAAGMPRCSGLPPSPAAGRLQDQSSRRTKVKAPRPAQAAQACRAVSSPPSRSSSRKHRPREDQRESSGIQVAPVE